MVNFNDISLIEIVSFTCTEISTLGVFSVSLNIGRPRAMCKTSKCFSHFSVFSISNQPKEVKVLQSRLRPPG